MNQKNVALVLGGGGSAGHAWTIGVVAGLAEAGIDLTQLADVMIGTSSGANAAAQLLAGKTPAELLAAVLAEPAAAPSPAGQNRPGPPAAVFEKLRAIGAAATSAAGLQRALCDFGLDSDAAFPPEAAARRRAMVGARLPSPDWPQRPMRVVAMNAETAEPVIFDRESGVELADAATAAISLPGAGPTHTINGVRYVSGGVRSADNADLATGYANVVVISPYSGQTGPLPPGQFEGIRRFPGADLKAQVETLRRQGSRVEVISPDAESRAAMGTNQMDPATRIPSARAGHAQGLQEAARLALP